MEFPDLSDRDCAAENYGAENCGTENCGTENYGSGNCGAENCGTGNYSIGNCAAGNCTADSPRDNSSGYRDYRRVRNADAGDENTGVLKGTGI